jgi:ABC-type bacteriocin/lantibiotic exporter with double-glycine peptidase domain
MKNMTDLIMQLEYLAFMVYMCLKLLWGVGLVLAVLVGLAYLAARFCFWAGQKGWRWMRGRGV